MMEIEKTKKRGRPAQLLQMVELHAFVEFLLEKESRTELQNKVINTLQAENFNFENLLEEQQILVKEALKPYREHLKLKLIYDELIQNQKRSKYEEKFIQLYQQYEKGQLDSAEVNILKLMCTRYLKFKAQRLEYSDLELYITHLHKKENIKKRKVEDRRKYQLGGAVMAAFKKLNVDTSNDTPDQIIERIINLQEFYNQVCQSEIFKEVLVYKKEPAEAKALFFEVLKGISSWEEAGTPIYCLETHSILMRKN